MPPKHGKKNENNLLCRLNKGFSLKSWEDYQVWRQYLKKAGECDSQNIFKYNDQNEYAALHSNTDNN